MSTPYDISGSAHWRNKADNCVAIWRHVGVDTPSVELHVQKVRFKHIGRPGLISLVYDRVTGRYSEPLRILRDQADSYRKAKG